MTLKPQPPFPKSRGDSIRSTDWNDLVSEVQALDDVKVNRAGDTLTGPLTVAGALGIGVAAAPDLPLRVQTGAADQAPLLALNTPNNEDFLSVSGGRRGSQLPFVAWKRGDLRVGTATAPGGAGFKELLRINSSDTAAARLEVDGRVRAGQLTAGSWPNNPLQYVFLGTNTLDQSQAGNYALLQGTASDIGTTYVNSPKSLHLRINNVDKFTIQNSGNIDVVAPTNMGFGAQTRQMINLWNSEYGIGIQSSTLYYRTGGHFAWYRGSGHNDNVFHPGVNGRTLMRLDSNGNLFIRGQIFQSVNFSDPTGPVIGPVIGIDPGIVINPSDLRLKQNVAPLHGALDRLLQLRGVTFDWKEPEKHDHQTTTQIGLIAQEVQAIFPQWVSTNADGYKQLAIRGFEALAVEALRALKAENERFRLCNQALELRVAAMEVQLMAPVFMEATRKNGKEPHTL